jgi:ATP-dependent RNA helicase SUPV3L1/SUV3
VRAPGRIALAFAAARANLVAMPQSPDTPLIAVLGPTNTGKTHLAIERMCGHSSGMIGFPLRLLAREVYERVVAIKGANQVALITGEEKIVPPQARYYLCTAESMPLDKDLAFVALDEAQIGADPERGHVFTDRLLRARGREETMMLGSDALRPMLRALIPKAEITSRPRFSTLAYAGHTKLSRLPKRSVIVAFSAEEVYAVAEMLRRLRGGAAVVMGALSPRTRNAQVAMYQAGEVDYLVATDAIGMGLNMDVAHVAFASLRKFDGKRQRRLTVAEMAQIAGRAGRHQRDGSFGTLAAEGESAMTPEEIAAIEGHHFPWIEHLYWRDGRPPLDSLGALIEGLEARPAAAVLRAAPEAIDLAVLKRLAGEDWVAARAKGKRMVGRLWTACSLPDFRKTGPEHHSRLVGRIYRHLSEGDGHLPQQWIAEEVARLDTVAGDVETIAGRIAAARTWAYVANRPDWLADPAEMAERARALEAKLSDALHQSLTQRFVDRRTAVLMRDLGTRGFDALPVRVGDDGMVTVDEEPIGRLTGFCFRVDPQARHADKKLLLAAAERRLGAELGRRVRQLAEDADDAFVLATDPGRPVALFWRGEVVARLEKGRGLLVPKLAAHRSLDALRPAERDAVLGRCRRWLAEAIARHLRVLVRIAGTAADPATPPALRAVLAPIAATGGLIERRLIEQALGNLDRDQRRAITKLGITIGTLDVFAAALLKPEATRWRIALGAVSRGRDMPELPPVGAVVLPGDPAHCTVAIPGGFRPAGSQLIRIDLVERIARAAHEARAADAPPDPALGVSLGLAPDTVAALMHAFGFRRADGQAAGWTWHGRRRLPREAPPRNDNAFAALAGLLG